MNCPTCGAPLADTAVSCARCEPDGGTAAIDRLELPNGSMLLLDKEIVTLGRGSGNDHILGDTSISRRHARLQRLPNGWLLIDLGSANGTFVNGDKVVVPYLLADGDQIMLGDQRALFRAGSGAIGPGGVTKRARAETILGRSAYGTSTTQPPTEPPSERPTGEQKSV